MTKIKIKVSAERLNQVNQKIFNHLIEFREDTIEKPLDKKLVLSAFCLHSILDELCQLYEIETMQIKEFLRCSEQEFEEIEKHLAMMEKETLMATDEDFLLQ